MLVVHDEWQLFPNGANSWRLGQDEWLWWGEQPTQPIDVPMKDWIAAWITEEGWVMKRTNDQVEIMVRGKYVIGIDNNDQEHVIVEGQLGKWMAVTGRWQEGMKWWISRLGQNEKKSWIEEFPEPKVWNKQKLVWTMVILMVWLAIVIVGGKVNQIKSQRQALANWEQQINQQLVEIRAKAETDQIGAREQLRAVIKSIPQEQIYQAWSEKLQLELINLEKLEKRDELNWWFDTDWIRPGFQTQYMVTKGEEIGLIDKSGKVILINENTKKATPLQLTEGQTKIDGVGIIGSEIWWLSVGKVYRTNRITGKSELWIEKPTSDWLFGVFGEAVYMISQSENTILRYQTKMKSDPYSWLPPTVNLPQKANLTGAMIDGRIWLWGESNGYVYQGGRGSRLEWTGLDKSLGSNLEMTICTLGRKVVIGDWQNQRVVWFTEEGIYNKQIENSQLVSGKLACSQPENKVYWVNEHKVVLL